MGDALNERDHLRGDEQDDDPVLGEAPRVSAPTVTEAPRHPEGEGALGEAVLSLPMRPAATTRTPLDDVEAMERCGRRQHGTKILLRNKRIPPAAGAAIAGVIAAV